MAESKVCPFCGERFFRAENDRCWPNRIYCCSAHQRAAYRLSDKGKAVQRRYRDSAHGKANKRRAQKRYDASEKGRATQARYEASPKAKKRKQRWNASPRGRASALRTAKNYQVTPEGRDAQARYQSSEKGRATKARYRATPQGKLQQQLDWLKWAGDNKGWAEYLNNRYQMLYIEKLPCTGCSESDVTKLQADHVLARGLGGTHDRSNLQILCKVCHRTKTREDLRKMRISIGAISRAGV